MIKLQIKFPIRSQMKKSVNFTLNVNNSDYLFSETATKEAVIEFDEIARNYYNEVF